MEFSLFDGRDDGKDNCVGWAGIAKIFVMISGIFGMIFLFRIE